MSVYDVTPNEEPIVEASNYSEMDVFLDVICASADNYNEAAIDNLKRDFTNVADLWKQWSKYTKSFVKHKWIYRYVDEKQKAQLQKHYEVLCNEKTNYSTYKRSFAAICKFVGIPSNTVIIENVVFKKDTKDKDQEIIAVRYSKGLVKVMIPEGIRLIHTSPATMSEMIPSFRSKTVGKYMYPTKRCFFTCIKAISTKKAGLEGETLKKYTPKQKITTAYIDPSYTDFASNSVYVETDSPIPVENYRSTMEKIGDDIKKTMKIGGIK